MDFLIGWSLALRATLPYLALWLLASVVLGLIAGPVLSMTQPDPPPPDRRFWERRAR
jgi:hypothetical protein